MKIIRHVFTFALLVLMLGSAMAQQQAGPVIDDIHRRNNPNHPGYVGNNAAAPVQSREVWQDKYGAIAADWAADKAGASEDENSMRAARRAAIVRCGSKNCKIVATTVNGCLASVYGSGRSAVGGGPNRESAINDALNKCRPADGSRCDVYYAHCSLPVRIR